MRFASIDLNTSRPSLGTSIIMKTEGCTEAKGRVSAELRSFSRLPLPLLLPDVWCPPSHRPWLVSHVERRRGASEPGRGYCHQLCSSSGLSGARCPH